VTAPRSTKGDGTPVRRRIANFRNETYFGARGTIAANLHAQEAGRRDGGNGDKIIRVVARKRAVGNSTKGLGRIVKDRAGKAR